MHADECDNKSNRLVSSTVFQLFLLLYSSIPPTVQASSTRGNVMLKLNFVCTKLRSLSPIERGHVACAAASPSPLHIRLPYPPKR